MKWFHFFRGTTGILALLGIFALAAPNRADVLIFKDGFTLVGKVKREGQVIFEGGQAIKVGNGSFVIDDDQTLPERALIKRTLFASRQVQDVDDKVIGKEPQVIALGTTLTPFSTAARMEPFGPILKATPWDNNWERTYEIQPIKQERIATKQRIVQLTPHAVWVKSSRFLWDQMYLTSELKPEELRNLLYSHPDLREKPGQPADPVKRGKIVQFLRQGAFYDLADQELDQWLKDDPAAKDKVAAERSQINQLRGSELADQIERAFRVGQHQWVQKRLENFPKEATDRQHARMATIKAEYEKAEESLIAARRFLKELPPRAFPEAHKVLFTEAAQAILNELNNDNYLRLETFITFAKQAERDRLQGRTPMHTPSDLLALAVSGWVLGNGSAEAKAEAGIRLWRARQFVQEYQRTDAVGTRQRLLNGYTRDSTETVAFDELAQVITNLPPSHPEAKLPTGPIPLTTDLPMGLRKSVNYIVQLPREYHHGRPYPVLFVLHQAIEKAADTIDRWSELAHQNGYILAAPEWPAKGQLKAKYQFSPEEHAAVLDTLRDMQRRFNVDTDRVFLAGVGQGGDMAMDVGMSHPDVFAGVIAMGVQPRLFTKAYANNAQYLPMYIVSGELASESPKAIRQVFLNSFIARGMPALYVEYKGRGNEWFTGELPTIFDWMNRKKRMMANPELSEMSSMRPGDNRFYWLSGEGINPTSVNDIDKWRPLAVPATLQGRIAESNTIRIHVKNWKTATIWFTRGMIEFDKPVAIWIGTELRFKDVKISPSLATLLEDFYLRGDRSRLYLARKELPLTNR